MDDEVEARLEEAEKEKLKLKTELKNMELKHLGDVSSFDLLLFFSTIRLNVMIL